MPLGNIYGDVDSKPVFNKDYITFNGVGDDAHETASVTKEASGFEFCKTARKPYDSVVVEFFKLIRKHAPSTILRSDGGDEVFGGQKIVVNDKYTYLTGQFDVKVGDVVLLPSRFDAANWEGTVTAIGSEYDGDCQTILSVKPVDDLAKTFESMWNDGDELSSRTPITAEKEIANILFDKYRLREEDAADASHEIIKIVCKHFASILASKQAPF